jgi:catechol 2,3-dioxygenase-like lactoylglutathione lyase family enzyme
VLPLPPGQGLSRLAHIGWSTKDAAALRAYLVARGATGVTPLETAPDGGRWFSARDPEGNLVQFLQPASADTAAEPGAISGRMIHVGFLVRSREAEDRFYRGLLGFRPYWYGAMRPGFTDWISQQVPDGHDWLEYMMVGEGSTTPLDRLDAPELGVLNHFSLGVRNMEASVTTLIAGDRLSPRHDGPQMGLDGKWQANLYDPDGTRVELMEFQPVVKPCCSEFTAASPAD